MRPKIKEKPTACPARGGHFSFPAGTLVVLADGTTKPIEKLAVGDDVMAADPETSESGSAQVDATIATPDDINFTTLTIDTGTGPSTVTATDNHPFWSPSQSSWVAAGDLKPGMTVGSLANAALHVTNARHFHQLQAAYNLTVRNAHTYYVIVDETPVLVHNAGREPGQRPDEDAEGRPHTTFRRDGTTGFVKKYVEWGPQTNPRNPAPFSMVKRFDLQGPSHYNIDEAGKKIEITTPHMNTPDGNARKLDDWEKPIGCE